MITTTIPPERHATHPGGYIGLQLHGIKEGTGPFKIAWRNLRVRQLTAAVTPSTEDKAKTKVGVKPAASAERVMLQHPSSNNRFRELQKVDGLRLS